MKLAIAECLKTKTKGNKEKAMLNCIEEILYYHRVDTSEFFIDICHSRSIGHWCCT